MSLATANGRATTVLPLVFGLVVMLSALVGPGWVPGLLALIAAFVAGWINSEEPVRAGLLTIVVPAAGALVRVVVDQGIAIGTFLLVVTSAAVLALIASHIGAGVKRRRTVRGLAT